MKTRIVLLVAAVAALLVSLVLMVSDDPEAPEPSQVKESVPFTVNGEPMLCDITVESNGDRDDTAEADCKEMP